MRPHRTPLASPTVKSGSRSRRKYIIRHLLLVSSLPLPPHQLRPPHSISSSFRVAAAVGGRRHDMPDGSRSGRVRPPLVPQGRPRARRPGSRASIPSVAAAVKTCLNPERSGGGDDAGRPTTLSPQVRPPPSPLSSSPVSPLSLFLSIFLYLSLRGARRQR
jgi:hypothetical protein